MFYKLCITAAGIGSRLSYSKDVNKALIPINKEAVISKIINIFSKKIEIIVAVGYQSAKLISYLKITHPDRNIKFVKVDKFIGKGAGPGYSLVQCKKYLNCPFIFMACDTIILKKPSSPRNNWIGISKVNKTKSFLVIEKNNKSEVTKFFDKKDEIYINKKLISKTTEKIKKFDAFIGLAGIKDYKIFWEGFKKVKKLKKNELQVSNALEYLQNNKKIISKTFKWFDTGSDESYLKTKIFFKDNFLIKPDEFLYIQNNIVIKYFKDKDRCKKRFLRSKYLNNIIPSVQNIKKHYLIYKFQKGKILSETNNIYLFEDFIHHINSQLWKYHCSNQKEISKLKNICFKFYKNKTYERLKLLLDNNKNIDNITVINKKNIPSIFKILKMVNWEHLSNGFFSYFHGDPQPENVIVQKTRKFVMIDWREDFGGSIKYGDVYYDLAKIYHALIISGHIIRTNKYSVKIGINQVNYKFQTRSNLIKYLKLFEKFILDQKYDLYKVKLISYLIYLNIAPLHHSPYSKLLFFHSKFCLNELLNVNDK